MALVLGGCDNFFSGFGASCQFRDEYGGGGGYGSYDGGAPDYTDYESPYYDYDPGAPDPDALLWSSRGGHAWHDFCRDKSPDQVLPPDPRSLIQPGVSDGRAVMFNMEWNDCHVDPELVGERPHPTTCGELQARAAAGDMLMRPSTPGGGALFSGNVPWTLPAGFGVATFPVRAYNDLWKVWGMRERPDNFDELVAQRYGTSFGLTSNPYPLPGEDPNETDGGSGQLPDFFTHIRTPEGTWTGRIGITCHGCHNGEAGTAADGEGLGRLVGSGSNVVDFNLFLRDMLPLGYPASLVTILNLNRIRGTNNASDVNLAFIFPDNQPLPPADELLGLITSGSTAGMDTPSWWNMGHKPVKFADGLFPMDAPRVDMVFYTPILGLFADFIGNVGERGQDWMRQHGQDINTWIESLKSPPYPYDIDVPLAEEGAVLFHELDLWAAGRANPVRRPDGGNGSCASCHGAYAPRYFNDPAYLAYPELEGMAGYMTPLDIIGTDPVRIDTNNEMMNAAGAINFFGYPPTAGTDNDCGPQNQRHMLEEQNREIGYMAQPLFGIWANAPYFHNGSVPSLRAVLDPTLRPGIWERWSTPARPDQEGQVVMGLDTDLTRAYDTENVGWRYDTHVCEFGDGIVPGLNCNPGDPYEDPLAQQILQGLYSNLILAWNIFYPPPITRSQMEARKIYNTYMFAQGNEGHEFSAVLTDHEIDALLEYMKTL